MLFVENCGPYIIRRNLCRNFLLHLVNLHDFNLVTTATIDRAMARMKEIEESLPELEEGQELSDATCIGHAVSSVFHYMANAPKVECQTDNSLFYKTNYEHNERDVV